MFQNLTCGEDNGEGSTPYGDVWVPYKATYKIRLVGNPTQSDRPASMYDASKVDAELPAKAAAGVAINGIGINKPTDAGDLSIDGAGFQLTCGGHVTPPLAGNSGSGPSGPPQYHYHKSPDCLQPFRNSAIEVSAGGKPYQHAELIGWAIDGFSIYAYQDVGGAAPIVDECGGHFGPVDDSGDVVYHYHSRTSVPYHLGCQGPSLGKCNGTQDRTNFCHPGCGYEVCVQPGTQTAKLEKYLSRFDPKWLSQYTVNNYANSGVRPTGKQEPTRGSFKPRPTRGNRSRKH